MQYINLKPSSPWYPELVCRYCCLFAHKLPYFFLHLLGISLQKLQGCAAVSATLFLNRNANRNRYKAKPLITVLPTFPSTVPERREEGGKQDAHSTRHATQSLGQVTPVASFFHFLILFYYFFSYTLPKNFANFAVRVRSN